MVGIEWEGLFFNSRVMVRDLLGVRGGGGGRWWPIIEVDFMAHGSRPVTFFKSERERGRSAGELRDITPSCPSLCLVVVDDAWFKGREGRQF